MFEKFSLWASRLILIVFSVVMLACGGAGSSMDGNGFAEFPRIETNDNVEYTFTLVKYFNIESTNQDVAVYAERSWSGEHDPEALSLAGFSDNASHETAFSSMIHIGRNAYTKEIGNTFYMTDGSEDSYGYIIEEPARDLDEIAAYLKNKWPDNVIFMSGAARAVLESHLSSLDKESRQYMKKLVDWMGLEFEYLETLFDDVEDFINDPLFTDTRGKVMIGHFRFSEERIELLIKEENGDLNNIVK